MAVTRTGAAPACAKGAIRWVGVSKERKLVAVSRPREVAKDEGWVRLSPVRVRELEPRIEMSGDGPAAERLLASLAKRLGWDGEELAGPGEPSDVEEHDERADFQGAGTFVAAQGVWSIEASFTADCSGKPVYGSVSTWRNGATASLQCGYDPSKHGSHEAWVLEAYELACGS
ncbi:hypothetical protein [Streptomyces sp. NPDC046909]|uniref:hypothetical protein n=1 Tax=Streptomyces sp. NPDC046909 TaxID=3155617 RepID=UPI0033D3578D